MTPNEEMYYLIIKFHQGMYDVNTFSNEFTRIYNYEVDYDTMNDDEKSALNELSIITARFSPYEEDLIIANVYFSEAEVRKKVQETIEKLIL